MVPVLPTDDETSDEVVHSPFPDEVDITFSTSSRRVTHVVPVCGGGPRGRGDPLGETEDLVVTETRVIYP